MHHQKKGYPYGDDHQRSTGYQHHQQPGYQHHYSQATGYNQHQQHRPGHYYRDGHSRDMRDVYGREQYYNQRQNYRATNVTCLDQRGSYGYQGFNRGSSNTPPRRGHHHTPTKHTGYIQSHSNTPPKQKDVDKERDSTSKAVVTTTVVEPHSVTENSSELSRQDGVSGKPQPEEAFVSIESIISEDGNELNLKQSIVKESLPEPLVLDANFCIDSENVQPTQNSPERILVEGLQGDFSCKAAHNSQLDVKSEEPELHSQREAVAEPPETRPPIDVLKTPELEINNVEEISNSETDSKPLLLELTPSKKEDSTTQQILEKDDSNPTLVQKEEILELSVSELTLQLEPETSLAQLQPEEVPELSQQSNSLSTGKRDELQENEIRNSRNNPNTMDEEIMGKLDGLYITPTRKGRKSRVLIDSTNIVESSSITFVTRELKQKEAAGEVVITPVRRSTRKKGTTTPGLQDISEETLRNAKLISNPFLNP